MFHPFFTNDFVAAASELSHATQRSGINSAFCNVPTKVTDRTSQQRRYFSEKHVSENFSRRNFAETKKSSYLCTRKNETGCSAVGSVPGLGPGCRRFESCHPDVKRKVFSEAFLFCFYQHTAQTQRKAPILTTSKDVTVFQFLIENEKHFLRMQKEKANFVKDKQKHKAKVEFC